MSRLTSYFSWITIHHASVSVGLLGVWWIIVQPFLKSVYISRCNGPESHQMWLQSFLTFHIFWVRYYHYYYYSSSQCTSPGVMDQNHIRCDSDQSWPSLFSEFIQNIRKKGLWWEMLSDSHNETRPLFPCIFGCLGKGLENLFALRNSTR